MPATLSSILLAAAATLGPVVPLSPSPAASPTAAPALVRLGESVMGYVARPKGAGPFPGVVVIHEWWGLNAQIRGVADRLAREGYLAVVPDLYHGKSASEPEKAHELMRGLDEEAAVADLAKAADWLVAEAKAGSGAAAAKKPPAIGSVGFCMGGRLSLLFGMADRRDRAVAVFYGRPETSRELLGKLAGPVLAFFGAEDEGLGPDKAKAFDAALAEAKVKHEVNVVAGAGHAFMNETRESYRETQAKDAWAKLLALFAKELR